MNSHTAYVRECQNQTVVETYLAILDQAESKHERSKSSELDSNVAPAQKFFPVSSLRNKIFDHERVTYILDHQCPECESHLLGNEQLPLSANVAHRILKSDAALSLFALLVVLKHPRLILVFLSHVDKNLMLPRYFSPDTLRDAYFSRIPRRSRDSLIDSFGFRKWQFSTPHFEHDGFSLYPDGIILPYLDEERIGKGSHGTVYKVWIHQDYCTFRAAKIAGAQENCPGAKILVRKEIIGEDRTGWIKEWSNLERIRTLNDPHLIEIQKTYQLYDKLNIVFPFAKTNLFEYLRDPKWRAPRTAPIRTNPMWIQVLGITNALAKIINFENPEKPDAQLFGSHSDLKPQNILIDNSAEGSEDVFKITDFGQTIFIDRAFASSTSPATGGTDAYCPPELMKQKRNNTYDVWSLGIIVLEILAFAIKGVKGLTDSSEGLDHIRVVNEAYHSHSRFYTQTSQGKVVLQESISHWMEQISNPQAIQDPEDVKFVQRLVQLCRSMLEPDMRLRVRIEDVLSTMRELFRITVPEPQQLMVSTVKRNDEVVLVNLKNVEYYYTGIVGKRSISLAMLESKEHMIRTFVEGSVYPSIDERQNMELLLPFQHFNDDIDNAFEFRFQPIKNGHASSLTDVRLFLRDWAVVQRVKMALIGHNISNRYCRESCTAMYHQNPFDVPLSIVKQGMRELISKFGGRSDSKSKRQCTKPRQESFNAVWVEIWEEKSQSISEVMTSNASSSGAELRRAKRQVDLGRQIPSGRVVVYCNDRILIMPFSKTGKITRHDDIKELRMTQITFEPMDPKQSESFPVSFLTPSSGQVDNIPGIPMSHQKLHEEEEHSRHECVHLQLKFRSVNDASDFYWLYRTRKGRWLDRTEGVESKNKNFISFS